MNSENYVGLAGTAELCGVLNVAIQGLPQELTAIAVSYSILLYLVVSYSKRYWRETDS